MNMKDQPTSLHRHSVWTGLLLVLVAAATLEATGLVQYFSSKKGLEEETYQRAQSRLALAEQEIQHVITSVEVATENLAMVASLILDTPDDMCIPLVDMLDANSNLLSTALAFKENYYPSKGLWYEPVAAAKPDGTFEVMVLGSESHDYFQSEWYQVPMALESGAWSDPYYESDIVNDTIVTYSTPILDREGEIVGVATADISLDWARNMIDNIKPYPGSFSIITSGNGTVIASPADTSDVKDPLRFTTPAGNTGWNVSIIIPKDSVYGDIKRINRLVLLLQLLGLMMISLILYSVARSQMKYTKLNEKKERMDNELQIAHGIQMAMLPNTFPPFPERKDIDIHASLTPAKEVGGDLYDFYIRADKLYFCVGDVSGKGVPAALVMAVTRSLFRAVAAHERSPLRIITTMNDSMATETNVSNMFVTFFCGVLDLNTGHMRYCNAGHNGPLVIDAEGIHPLPVEPNLPLGIEPNAHFVEQETDFNDGDSIFIYTDGVTEAETALHQMFGEERMKEVLAKGPTNAKEALENLNTAIYKFVGGAEQSDDKTTMLIRYMNSKTPESTERHLLLHNDIRQIPQLAGFIEAISKEIHLDQSLAMSLNLALEEAVTNVIMYAYPKDSDGLVDIEAIIRKDSIDFTIIDSGKEFDPTGVPDADVNASVEDRPIGGLGIFLVRNIMDSVSYRRYKGKNILSMTKRL